MWMNDVVDEAAAAGGERGISRQSPIDQLWMGSDGCTSYESCVTRNHIEVWNERVLPPGALPIAFATILRGSLGRVTSGR